MDMIWCPPGTFTMGSPTTEAIVEDPTRPNIMFPYPWILPRQVRGNAGSVRSGDWINKRVNLTRQWQQQPPGRESNLGGGGCVLHPVNHARAGSRPITCRLGLCVAHRVAMGICLPCGHDHGILMGGDNCQFECEL